MGGGVQIRIAKDKKPVTRSQHRDFTDHERTINKLTTKEDFIEYYVEKPDPYALKAAPDSLWKKGEPGSIKYNPFRVMPEHRLKEFCKYWEKTPDYQAKYVQPYYDAARWIFLFKDITHLTTSECVALTLEAQKRLANSKPNVQRWISEDNLNDAESANEAASIIRSVIEEFPSHWSEWMDQIEVEILKGHRKVESSKK
jgi:hypothetical protein